MLLIPLAGGTGVGASKNHLGDVFSLTDSILIFLVYECTVVPGGMGEEANTTKREKTNTR